MTTTYSSRGTAVITGASGGIGSRYAEQLARRGYDLILVARDIGRINALCDRMASEFSVCAEGLAADLGEPDGLQRVEERLRADERVTMLVNNAGTGATTTLVDSRQAQIDQMISLNVAALTRLTYSVVPGFIERGTGTLINIASVVGLVPELLNGVYGATKAYVLAFSRSLQHELASKGVRVQVVLPGAIATKFWADSGLPVEQLPSEVVMSRRSGLRRARGIRFGRVRDHPFVARYGGLECLRKGTRRAAPESFAHAACDALSSANGRCLKPSSYDTKVPIDTIVQSTPCIASD